jgi:hypothetical protein
MKCPALVQTLCWSTLAVSTALGCATRGNEGTGSAGSNECEAPSCGSQHPLFSVSPGSGGAELSDVAVTIIARPSEQIADGTPLTCPVAADAAGTTCSWPPGPNIEGNYQLQVAATGYTSQTFTVALTVPPTDACQCPIAELVPAAVTLAPM